MCILFNAFGRITSVTSGTDKPEYAYQTTKPLLNQGKRIQTVGTAHRQSFRITHMMPRYITNGNTGQSTKGQVVGEQSFGPYGNAVDPSIINNMATLLGKYHVHPKGNNMFIQPPSQSDLSNAIFPINIVAGTQSRMICFYNNTGIINQMTFSRFMRGCNQ